MTLMVAWITVPSRGVEAASPDEVVTAVRGGQAAVPSAHHRTVVVVQLR
jgi:hypothetical protein